MKSTTTFGLSILLGAAALITSGCSNKKLIFATHSSIGLDVSGTAEVPNKVSLSYHRQELALVPGKTDETAHSVFGGMDSDINFWRGSIIKQTFATGDAAIIATQDPESEAAATCYNSDDPNPAKKKSLVFVTGTTFGLHLSAGDGQVQPNLLMGYRRAEGAYIPVTDPGREVKSVYADILINTKTKNRINESGGITTNFPATKGARIKQSFATGSAAENLASNNESRAALYEAAGLPKDAAEIRIQMDGDVDKVLKKVAPDGSVDGKKLKNLLEQDGTMLSGTDQWPGTFGGVSASTFRGVLTTTGNKYVPLVVKRIKERDGN